MKVKMKTTKYNKINMDINVIKITRKVEVK